MWEYKTETYAGNLHYTRGRLNEDRATLDRWEAIAFDFTGNYTIVVFKRLVQ